MLDVAADEAVVHLGADEPRQPFASDIPSARAICQAARLQKPTESTLPDATRWSSARERLLDRRERVEPVDLVEVDPVGPEPPERRLAGPDEVEAAQARVVRPRPIRPNALVASTTRSRRPAEGLAQDLLGLAVAVDVGGVDEVDPGVHAPAEQIAWPSGTSIPPKPQPSPKVIVPRQSSLTRTPVRRRVCNA